MEKITNKFVYIRNKPRRDKCKDNENRKILIWSKIIRTQAVLGGKCCKCGDSRAYVLCFHHTDTENKDFYISEMRARKVRLDDLIKEISKCILVCHNCHREIHSNNGKSIRSSNKQLCLEYLGKNKCEICSYNRCMDAIEFHHIDPKTKKYKISRGIGSISFKLNNRFKEELDKCSVFCRNCHQVIHTDVAFFETHLKVIVAKSKTLTIKNRIDSQQVIYKYTQERKDIHTISKELSCSAIRVYEILKAYKIFKCTNIIDKKEIIKLWEKGLSRKDIKEKIGCSKSAVNATIRRYDEAIISPN